MSWLTGLVIANLVGIGSNFDNSGVGLAYGATNIRFPHWVNCIVNVIGLLMALIGAVAGKVVGRYISPVTAAWVSCLVLCAIGLFILYSAYIRPHFGHKGGHFNLCELGWRDGIILGFALSFTNIASGFSATVTHASLMLETVGSIALWGYIMVWVGNVVGIGTLARFLGQYAALVSGCILVAVGIYQVY